MSLGFGLLGIALLGAARVIYGWPLQNTFSSSLLRISALGSLLVAVSPLPDSPPLVHEVIHQVGGFVLFGAAALAMTRIAPADNDGRAAVRRLGRVTAASVILFFLMIIVKAPVVGLLQRVVLAALCAWIATVMTTTAHPRHAQRQCE